MSKQLKILRFQTLRNRQKQNERGMYGKNK